MSWGGLLWQTGPWSGGPHFAQRRELRWGGSWHRFGYGEWQLGSGWVAMLTVPNPGIQGVQQPFKPFSQLLLVAFGKPYDNALYNNIAQCLSTTP